MEWIMWRLWQVLNIFELFNLPNWYFRVYIRKEKNREDGKD